MSNLTPTELVQQAKITAESYFHTAVRVIDSKFGDGYAKASPGLVGDFMKTAAMDFESSFKRQALDHVSNDLDRLASAFEELSNKQTSIGSTDISQLCDSMDRSSGDMLEGCTRIAKAIEERTGVIERTKNND